MRGPMRMILLLASHLAIASSMPVIIINKQNDTNILTTKSGRAELNPNVAEAQPTPTTSSITHDINTHGINAYGTKLNVASLMEVTTPDLNPAEAQPTIKTTTASITHGINTHDTNAYDTKLASLMEVTPDPNPAEAQPTIKTTTNDTLHSHRRALSCMHQGCTVSEAGTYYNCRWTSADTADCNNWGVSTWDTDRDRSTTACPTSFANPDKLMQAVNAWGRGCRPYHEKLVSEQGPRNSYTERITGFGNSDWGPHQISNWGVAAIADFSALHPWGNINVALEWNTADATSMDATFKGASAFNNGGQPLVLDTGSVTDMGSMFEGTIFFDQPLVFDTGSVTDMGSMFAGAEAFNQPLDFQTSGVTDMSSMFAGALVFDKPLVFDTSLVHDMSSMFEGAAVFNQELGFNTVSVTDMGFMFAGATAFNKQLDFSTSSVTDMGSMFKGVDEHPNAFNNGEQPGASNLPLDFDTSSVTDMSSMFEDAADFDQLLPFDTSSVTTMVRMFQGASSFHQPELHFSIASIERAGGLFEMFTNENLPNTHFGEMRCERWEELTSIEWGSRSPAWWTDAQGHPTAIASSACAEYEGTCEHGNLKDLQDRLADDQCASCDDGFYLNVHAERCARCSVQRCHNGIACSEQDLGNLCGAGRWLAPENDCRSANQAHDSYCSPVLQGFEWSPAGDNEKYECSLEPCPAGEWVEYSGACTLTQNKRCTPVEPNSGWWSPAGTDERFRCKVHCPNYDEYIVTQCTAQSDAECGLKPSPPSPPPPSPPPPSPPPSTPPPSAPPPPTPPPPCAPDCTREMLMDDACNEECNTPACGFDSGTCTEMLARKSVTARIAALSGDDQTAIDHLDSTCMYAGSNESVAQRAIRQDACATLLSLRSGLDAFGARDNQVGALNWRAYDVLRDLQTRTVESYDAQLRFWRAERTKQLLHEMQGEQITEQRAQLAATFLEGIDGLEASLIARFRDSQESDEAIRQAIAEASAAAEVYHKTEMHSLGQLAANQHNLAAAHRDEAMRTRAVMHDSFSAQTIELLARQDEQTQNLIAHQNDMASNLQSALQDTIATTTADLSTQMAGLGVEMRATRRDVSRNRAAILSNGELIGEAIAGIESVQDKVGNLSSQIAALHAALGSGGCRRRLQESNESNHRYGWDHNGDHVVQVGELADMLYDIGAIASRNVTADWLASRPLDSDAREIYDAATRDSSWGGMMTQHDTRAAAGGRIGEVVNMLLLTALADRVETLVEEKAGLLSVLHALSSLNTTEWDYTPASNDAACDQPSGLRQAITVNEAGEIVGCIAPLSTMRQDALAAAHDEVIGALEHDAVSCALTGNGCSGSGPQAAFQDLGGRYGGWTALNRRKLKVGAVLAISRAVAGPINSVVDDLFGTDLSCNEFPITSPRGWAEEIFGMRRLEESFTFANKAQLRAALVAWDADASAAAATYGPVAQWDVTAVTDFSGLCSGLANFDEDLSAWDTSRVLDMGAMFSTATSFSNGGQPLTFDTGSVTSFGFMFWRAAAFNVPVAFDTSGIREHWLRGASVHQAMFRMFGSTTSLSDCNKRLIHDSLSAGAVVGHSTSVWNSTVDADATEPGGPERFYGDWSTYTCTTSPSASPTVSPTTSPTASPTTSPTTAPSTTFSAIASSRVAEIHSRIAQKLADLLALSAWMQVDGTSSADDGLLVLPELPPPERIRSYLAAAARAQTGNTTSAAAWALVGEAAEQGLAGTATWFAQDSQLRSLRMQQHAQSEIDADATRCIQDGGCDDLEKVTAMISSLQQKRDQALLQATETLYTQRKAYEFWALDAPRVPLSLEIESTSADLLKAAADLESEALTARQTWEAQRGNSWHHHSFTAADHPEALAQLRETGQATFLLPLPELDGRTPDEYNVRYTSVRTYLLPPPRCEGRKSWACRRQLSVSKGPFSNFLDRTGDAVSFRHSEVWDRFHYDSQCNPVQQEDDEAALRPLDLDQSTYSPFGSWRVEAEVDGEADHYTFEELQGVQEVRFEFQLMYEEQADGVGSLGVLTPAYASDQEKDVREHFCAAAPAAEPSAPADDTLDNKIDSLQTTQTTMQATQTTMQTAQTAMQSTLARLVEYMAGFEAMLVQHTATAAPTTAAPTTAAPTTAAPTTAAPTTAAPTTAAPTTASPTASPTEPPTTPYPTASPTTPSMSCSLCDAGWDTCGICLVAVPANECPAASGGTNNIRGCSSDLGLGGLCEWDAGNSCSDGAGGLNNCGGYDVYRRVECAP